METIAIFLFNVSTLTLNFTYTAYGKMIERNEDQSNGSTCSPGAPVRSRELIGQAGVTGHRTFWGPKTDLPLNSEDQPR